MGKEMQKVECRCEETQKYSKEWTVPVTASAGLLKLVILGIDASRLCLPVVPWLNYFRYFTLTLGNHRLFWEENRKKRTVVMGKLSKRQCRRMPVKERHGQCRVHWCKSPDTHGAQTILRRE